MIWTLFTLFPWRNLGLGPECFHNQVVTFILMMLSDRTFLMQVSTQNLSMKRLRGYEIKVFSNCIC